MGQELLSICPVETRRLLWILGMMFGLILVLQHLELPYRNPLSSVLSATKVPLEGNSGFRAGDPPSNFDMVGNVSVSDGLNHTDTYAFHEIANNTRTSDLVSDESGGSDRTLEMDEDEDESGSLVKQNTTVVVNNEKNLETDIVQGGEAGNLVKENTTDITLSEGRTEKESNITNPVATTPPAYPPVNSSPNTSPVVVETHIGAPFISVDSNVTLVENDQTPSSEKTDNSEQLHTGLNETGNGSSVTRVPVVNTMPEVPTLEVYTLSDMNKLLHHSRTSYHSVVCLKFFSFMLFSR